jgi:hypothetical protein
MEAEAMGERVVLITSPTTIPKDQDIVIAWKIDDETDCAASSHTLRDDHLRQVTRIVIKIGDSLVASRDTGLRPEKIDELANEIAALQSSEHKSSEHILGFEIRIGAVAGQWDVFNGRLGNDLREIRLPGLPHRLTPLFVEFGYIVSSSATMHGDESTENRLLSELPFVISRV